jgi:hypothetical protein
VHGCSHALQQGSEIITPSAAKVAPVVLHTRVHDVVIDPGVDNMRSIVTLPTSPPGAPQLVLPLRI